LKTKWNFVAKKDRPKEHEKDYFVPNFGEDSEITSIKDSEKQAQEEVWSSRLAGQIGSTQAAAQIDSDAKTWREEAKKAQKEADAAAARAAAAEADAKAAHEKAVSDEFKNIIRSREE